LVVRFVDEAVSRLPPAERGETGLPGPRGEKGDPGESIKGDSGERGPEGPPGKLALVKAWKRGVHYEADVVAHAGSTYQALRDTAEEPPHKDWIVIAARGEEPYVGEVMGLYRADAEYRKFDLVTMNGSEWRAKKDNPGELPGPDWALAAKTGERGNKGERGERGPIGPAGPPAPRIREWTKRGYEAVPVMSDGTLGPALDLREFFELYDDESVR
jgi:integrin beta 3